MVEKRRVLIADDDPSMRSMLELMLDQNFRVDIATNCAETTHYLDTYLYDVVVLDIHLHDGSGLALLERFISEEHEHQPHAIIISADNKPEQIRKAYALGAMYFICKPFSIEAFGILLQRFLADLPALEVSRKTDENLALNCAHAVIEISLLCQSIESEETLARQVTRLLKEAGLTSMIRLRNEMPNKCFDSEHGLCTDMEPAIFDTMEQCSTPLHLKNCSFFTRDGISLLIKTMPDQAHPQFTTVCELINQLLKILAEAQRGILRRKVTRKAIAILSQIDHKIEQADQHMSDVQANELSPLSISAIGKEIRALHNQLSRSIDKIKEDVKKVNAPLTKSRNEHSDTSH